MKNKNEIKEQTRNSYIDFLRGIAAISIISIHTAFWSGESYVPEWFRNLTLFLDVPFFFFLSGWGSSYGKIELNKALKSLGRILSKWIVFILFVESVCLILINLGTFAPTVGLVDIRDFVKNVFFQVSFPGFPVIAGSIWFMPVYFVVVLCTTIIISVIGIEKFKSEAGSYLILTIVLFLWVYYGNSFLGMNISEILFYSIFWMMGFCMSEVEMQEKNKLSVLIRNIVIAIIGIGITNYLQSLPIYDIQNAKFPPSPKYAFVSLISIEIAKFFNNRVRSGKIYTILAHIGRNAIFYFFAQGIGSSLLFIYVSRYQTNVWVVKWIIALLINLILTVIIAEILRVIYKLLVAFKNITFGKPKAR